MRKYSVRPAPPNCQFQNVCGPVNPNVDHVLARAEHFSPDGGLYKCDTTRTTIMIIPAQLKLAQHDGQFCEYHHHLLCQVAASIEESELSDMTVPFFATLTKEELRGEFSQLEAFSSDATASTERKSRCWCEVTLIGSDCNAIEGKQTAFIDEEITVSCYVYIWTFRGESRRTSGVSLLPLPQLQRVVQKRRQPF